MRRRVERLQWLRAIPNSPAARSFTLTEQRKHGVIFVFGQLSLDVQTDRAISVVETFNKQGSQPFGEFISRDKQHRSQ
ncbi:hypothetical protein DVT68_16265 [Dyella solisilvae]|uniref:Uncharacterized protein n=1 Tax=Dyella solisilvae TaxID=1920168 RepID=A0A370K3Y4_9GAMM|nr:hypothetical protein DVT68_16265 [Dyella solisilvae]